MNYSLFVWLSLASISATAAAAPGRFADLAQLDNAVQIFTGAAIGTPGGAIQPVDRRLKLVHCQSQLVVNWHGRRQDNVRIECPDQGGWRIFVPLAIQQGPGQADISPIVARGDMVTIAVSGSGFSVQQTGKAMDAGVAGDWVRVTPSGAKQPIRAQIVRPGLVQIPIN